MAARPIARASPAIWARAETFAILALTLVLVVLYLGARDSGPMQALEGAALDWRFRLRGPESPGPDVAIVAIDDRTLAELGRWPFSRTQLAAAVDAVAADGARAIAFDLLLVGPEESGTGAADTALAQAIERAGNVVIPFAFVFDPVAANVTDLPPAIAAAAIRLVVAPPGRAAGLQTHPAGILAPLPSFLAAGRPAHVTVFLEDDGSVRFAHPAIQFGDGTYPSLPLEAARLFLGLDRDDVAVERGAGITLGERTLPTGSSMALAIDFAGPGGTYPRSSLADIAGGAFAPGTFRDKVVLIGPTAVGLGDGFVTPFDPKLPGVEVFATVVDDILSRGFLERSPRADVLDVLAIALAGVLAAALGLLQRPALVAAGGVALLAAWGALDLAAFLALGLWLNLVFPATVLVLGTALAVVGRGVHESRLRRSAERERAGLSRYVSPLAAARLYGRSGDGSGESQVAAIMFVDLVGSTRLGETMTPAETAALLRRFHRSVERAALDHRGTIDKFVGDGALVVFGVPAGGPADAARAIACARQIVADVARWRAELEADGKPGIACGIGLHFGPVLVAEVGGDAHAQVTVAGDTVNVASRLEAMTRAWRTTLIASDAAVEAARNVGANEILEGFRALPLQEIRGRERPLAVWAWPAPPEAPET
jgi:adenylate cyclase